MRAKDVVKLAEKKGAYLFKFNLSKLEPAGTRGSDEEAGVTMFG